MRRKISSIFLLAFIFSFIFVLASCGNDDNQSNTEPTQENGNKDNTNKEDKYYTITFKDYDGTLLQTNSVKEGETPSYNKGNPKRENDDNYSYTFSGWNPEISKVTTDTVYTATYTKIELSNITIDLNGGISSATKLQFKTNNITKDLLPFDLTKDGYVFKGYELNNILVFDEEGNRVAEIGMSATMTFKAKWEVKVAYKVEHYLQNIDDDNYPDTPVDIDNLTGTTNELTNASVRTYEGFTAPATITQEKIKADGTTVIKIYYTRNSYTLTVSMNDMYAGYFEDSYSGTYKYGKEIDIKLNRDPGYTFDGWYKNDNPYLTETSFKYKMEASNVKLEAKFTINIYTLTVDNQAEGVEIKGITSGQYEYSYGFIVDAFNIPDDKYLLWYFNDNLVNIGDYCGFSVPSYDSTIRLELVDNLNGIVYTRKDNKIYYGTYPQTLVNETTEAELINELNDYAKDKCLNKYYYGKLYEEGYSFNYLDVDYDNNGTYDYRGIYLTEYRPNSYLIDSSADNSYQDDNGFIIEKMYWFKYEPVEWIVLYDGDETLIVANLILDSYEYYPSNSLEQRETDYYGNCYANNYRASKIRDWLTVCFNEVAFNNLEKIIIIEKEVQNDKKSTESENNIYTCSDVSDSIFLLSRQEVSNYFDSSEAKQAKGTDYAKCMGLEVSSADETLGNSQWWLRSPYYDEYIEDCVCRTNVLDYKGNYSGCYVYYNSIGVRPACWIKL